ncbi:uncharacterized protein KY384_006109 [Bacidia gigantensis]|uniref:uncharacterized protein n=1 Tax=Bacidia gigantensis TaxID=2732470 RepID=UPI001D04ADF3|nr:uncharacterized protein KY384_006109 [Bacidia gigantensis]KAG8529472.1 hypothetical protein KY384_006109 [Bacidia gigantensis]
MDISGLVVTSVAICFEITSTLYKYGKEVKGARRDIQNLSNELFALVGALEHYKSRLERQATDAAERSAPPAYSATQSTDRNSEDVAAIKDSSSGSVASVLEQTIDFLRELQRSLAVPTTRFKRVTQVMAWPLKEGQVQTHLNRLERVKTFFILSLVTDEVDQSREMANEIMSLRTMLHDVTLKQQAREASKEYQAMVKWLCPVDPRVTRRAVEKQRMAGTGTWFTKSEPFQSQTALNESSCFWLNGITIGEIENRIQMHQQLAYFYCSFSNDESLHTEHILGSILAQLCDEHDQAYYALRQKFASLAKEATSKAIPKLDIDTLVTLLIQHVKSRGRVYLVIDGINECIDPHEVLYCLEKILTAGAVVQLVVSSINERSVDKCIDQMPSCFNYTISPSTISNDVELLVKHAVEANSRLKELPQSVKLDVISKLTDGAKGMFRWVQCQLDILSRLRTPGAVQKALAALPPTLDKTYETLLERVDGEEDKALTRQILEVVAFSLRPLRLREVCMMLQITPGLTRLDESKCLTHPKDILDICGSLLKYNEKNDVVSLAHHSVYVYLTSSPRNNASFYKLNEQEAHRNLTLICVTYLSFDEFAGERENKSGDDEVLYEKYPLLMYATDYWAPHMKRVRDTPEPLWGTLRRFLLSGEDGRQNFVNWVQLLIPESSNAKTTPPLYYASSYGLTAVVKFLLKLGADTEVHAGRGGATPINIAAYRGRLDVVKLLLEHNADPRKRDKLCDLDAVQWANYQGCRDVADYFRQQGYGFKEVKY